MTGSDDDIKSFKEDNHYKMQTFKNWATCRRCLTDFLTPEIILIDVATNNEPMQTICPRCTLRHALETTVAESITPQKTICKYCDKKRKLVGVWCKRCRDLSNKNEIERLLAMPLRNYDEDLALEFYKSCPIWKEFE